MSNINDKPIAGEMTADDFFIVSINGALRRIKIESHEWSQQIEEQLREVKLDTDANTSRYVGLSLTQSHHTEKIAALQTQTAVQSGETISLAGGVFNGCITTAGTLIVLQVPMARVMSGVTPSITKMSGGIRTVSGQYADNRNYAYDWTAGLGTYNEVIEKVGDTLKISITRKDGAAFTNAKSNTPVTFIANALTIDFKTE